VASVTGAVASVTGNVGGNLIGNVNGSVGSVAGNVSGSVGSVLGNVGGTVATVGSLGANAITATSIATGAITSAKFAAGAIDASAIAAEAITASELGQTAASELSDSVWSKTQAAYVTAGQFGIILNGTVTTVTGNVNGNVNGAVGTVSNVATGAIQAGDIGAGAITSSTFAANAIDATVIADNALDANAIAAGAITSSKIATGAITAGTFAAGAIDAAAIATDAIGASEWAANASGEVADGVWDEARAGHTTAGTFGFYLDAQISGITAGGGGILTAANIQAIRDTVWNTPTSFGFVPSSMGSVLNTGGGGGGGSCAGTGQYAVTITVKDTSSAPDVVIANARVTINNVTQTGVPYVAFSNVNGQVTFLLDNGTYIRQTQPPGYVLNVDTFTVSNAARPTDQLQQYSSIGALRPLVIRYDVPSGYPSKSWVGLLSLRSVNDSLLRVGDTSIASGTPWSIRIVADQYGEAVVPLWPNPTFTNDSTFYTLTINDQRNSVLLPQTKFRLGAGTAPIEWTNVPKWRRN
jgi:hypothetical protein